jgi:hypothetical protein
MNTIKNAIETMLNLFTDEKQQDFFRVKYQILLFDEDESIEFKNTLKTFVKMLVAVYEENNINKTNNDETKFEEFDLMDYLNTKTNNFFENNPEILEYSDDVKLIVGNVQSGKTAIICSLCILNILDNRKSTVVILRNLTGDYNQFASKFGDNGPFSGKELHLNENINILFVGNRKDEFNIEKIGNALVGITPTIVVAIANNTEIKRLVDIVKFRNPENVDFDIILDECDDLGYKKNMTCQYINTYNEFKNYSTQIFGITATAFDVMLMEKNLPAGKIFRLERPLNYKGIRDIDFRPMSTNTTFTLVGKKLKLNKEMVKLYLGIQETRYENAIHHSDEKYSQDFPNIILHKVSLLTGQHEKFIQSFATMKELKYWTCITYNGKGVSIYSTSLNSLKEFKVNETIGYKKEHNIWHFKGVGIGDILQELRTRDPNAQIFSNIAIASGKLASRGVNFSSKDYRWHLTHQILSTSKSSSVSDLIQSIRLCGIYTDDVPLILYTPQEDINDLRKSCELHENLIDGAINNEDEEKLMHELYSNIPVYSDLIPKRKISTKSKYNFSKVDRDDPRDWRRILPNKLVGKSKAYYNRMVAVFTEDPDYNGNGIRTKSEVLSSMTDDKKDQECIRSTSWPWHKDSSKLWEAVTHDTQGLLFKMDADQWMIKYN